MRLFWQEMKKIWRPGILAAIILIGVMFYWVRPELYLRYYGGHRPSYQLAAEWAEKYGPTMEQSERDELDAQLAEEKETFAQLIANIPEAVEAGLTDYDTFVAFMEDHHDRIISSTDMDNSYSHSEDFTQHERLIRHIQGGTNYERIEDLDRFLYLYDLAIEEPTSSWKYFLTEYTPQEQARILELEAMDQRGYLPETSTTAYFRYLSIWNIMGVILLLSPTLVRDRLRRVRSMQWSSRTGRRVLNTQIMAGLASSLLFSAISTAVYSALFLANGVLIFRDFPLYNSARDFPWFDMTYGQYILALVWLALLAGLITGALTLLLSHYSGNYVSMLLKAVPLFLVLWIAVSILEDSILFFHRTYLLSGDLILYWPKGLELVLFALLLALGLGLCTRTCARQKKKELL